MVLKSTHTRNWFGIVFVILFVIVAPVLTLLVIGVLVLYGYFCQRQIPTMATVVTTMQGLNTPLFWLACGLALITFPVYYTQGYATYVGFPSVVITYYHHPVTSEAVNWSGIFRMSAVNPLNALLNIVQYYLLLKLIGWGYRRMACKAFL